MILFPCICVPPNNQFFLRINGKQFCSYMYILFYFCTHVHLLWLQFAQCLKTKCGTKINGTPETCILGMLSDYFNNIINTWYYIVLPLPSTPSFFPTLKALVFDKNKT
jgi:hypothetical protein